MPRPALSANSQSVVATPPRVGSRSTRTAAPDSSSAPARELSGAQSLLISPAIISPRASMTAVPWSPAVPEIITASPGRMAAGERPGYFITPMPAVLM